ncbi:MAG: hypothetical protein LPK09_11385 [Hymenobacteraceae bacterium]|nr:hypothetical protein [Hymenobacteraceae bacterium]
MKKTTIYHAIVPVIALFAVGCSSPVAMQSTEYDDMYYSSSDRTEYVQPQAPEQQYASAEESAISAQPSTGNVTDNYYADEYYDGRTYRPQATWSTPNYAYVDPYWTTSYVRRVNRYNAFYDPFFYDPFYDPFYYDPFFPRNRFMVSVNIGYGWGSGWNRWGNHYDPFYGHRWWPYNNYYSGYYHGYHHGYYGGNRYVYDRPIIVNPRKVQYGPRDERSAVPATGGERVAGRPDRTQSVRDEQRAVQPGVDYARPGRVERGGTNTRGQQVDPTDDAKQVLPARPSTTTRGYDPQSGQVRPSRQQPMNEQPVQRMSPSRERNVSPATQPRPVQRQERVQPVQRQERTRPVQRQPVQRTQPVQRQQRSEPSYERSQPVRSESNYTPSRSSGTSSPPARTNSSGGGRPSRGGN